MNWRRALSSLSRAHLHAPDLVDLSRAGPVFDARSVTVLPAVISEAEEEALVQDCEFPLRRRRYQAGHWDQVIEKYKEVEKLNWNAENRITISRVRSLIQEFVSGGSPVFFLPIHVIDLAKEGYIKPHVDSVKFSGGFVAGLSLLSTSVMRLQGEKDPFSVVELLLEPRSLYIMQGTARYDYTHAVLEGHELGGNQFKGRSITRGRRISLMFRDEHPDDSKKRGKREEKEEA